MSLTDTDGLPPLAELEAAVHRSPGDVAAWRELASGYSAVDHFELAVDLLEHAVRLAPGDALTRQFLGAYLCEAGRPRDAIRHLEEALRLDPDGGAALFFDLGAAFDKAGDHATAVVYFRRTLALEPWMGAGWIRLGWALVADQRYAEAVPAFEQVTRRRPKCARSWHDLGIAYARTGRDAAAIQSFRLSLRIDPDQPDVHSDLQASYRALAGPDGSAAAVAES